MQLFFYLLFKEVRCIGKPVYTNMFLAFKEKEIKVKQLKNSFDIVTNKVDILPELI